jgi:hypothetical protein
MKWQFIQMNIQSSSKTVTSDFTQTPHSRKMRGSLDRQIATGSKP